MAANDRIVFGTVTKFKSKTLLQLFKDADIENTTGNHCN